jgi:hypothetical protein
MKKLSIVALLLLAVIVSAAADKDLSPLIGTWVNQEYDGTRNPPKFVYKADGIVEEYGTSYAKEPSILWKFTVEEAWQDSEGVHWYKVIATQIQTRNERIAYLLIRISPDGKTYEEDYIRLNHREFSTELNPRSYFYKILYRD